MTLTSVARYVRGFSIGALLLLAGCGSGGGGSAALSGNQPAAPTLNVDFERNTVAADGSFKVVVWATDANGAVTPMTATPSAASTRGSLSAFTTRSDGKRESTITPDLQKTGEYRVQVNATVAGNVTSITRTAVVMAQVAAGWGQPMAVEGLVNTGGTQDSLAISPDGQYLFLQYYPVSLSCILNGMPNSAVCQTATGPIAAPHRPNLPGANRVGSTTVMHGCPSLNFNPAPVPVPPIALYGFRRQADGSYAEPFVFLFTGHDGCFSPWGPTVRANGDGTYRMFMAFNDLREAGTAMNFAHIYDFNFTPGNTVTLGNVGYAGGVLINNFALNKATVGGTDGHRGNPHVHYNGNTPQYLLFDEETKPSANQYINVATWNGSSWNTPVALNFAPFNPSGFGDTQPYFDGTQLIIRNGLQLVRYAYNGGALNSAASWTGPTALLTPQVVAPLTGSVIVVGEPSVATINGQQVLFFVYGLQQANGAVNLRVGFVSKN